MFRAFWEDLALLFTTISGDLGWANITPSSDPKSSKQLIQTCCPSTAPAKSADVFLLKGNIWGNIRCLAYHSFSHSSSKILNEAHRFSELTLILNHSGPYPRLPWEPCFWRYLTPKTYPKDLQSQQVIWDISIKPYFDELKQVLTQHVSLFFGGIWDISIKTPWKSKIIKIIVPNLGWLQFPNLKQ